MRTPQLRRFPSPNGRGISAVVLLTTVGLTLAAQVAGAQTTAGSSVAPLNEVRAASRHQARQLAAKDVLRGEATPRRERPTSNSRLSIPLAGAGLKSALHDARFGEAWGSNLNSPHVGGAAIF